MYLRRKTLSRMTLQGYPTGLAKLVLAALEDGDDVADEGKKVNLGMATCNPAAIATDSVCHWTEPAKNQELADVLEKIYVPAGVAARRTTLLSYLTDNPKSGGAMGRVEVSQGGLSCRLPIGVEADYVDDDGARPWLVCLKPYAFRYGPHAFPLAGFGCILHHVCGPPMSIIAVPAKELLSQGISLPDLPAYYNTSGGAKNFDMCKVVIKDFRRGGMAWIPFGWVAWPLFYKDAEDAAPAGQAEQTDGGETKVDTNNDLKLPCFAHWPVFSQAMAQKVGGQVSSAIFAWNRQHLNKNASSRAYASRAAVFEKFEKSLG